MRFGSLLSVLIADVEMVLESASRLGESRDVVVSVEYEAEDAVKDFFLFVQTKMNSIRPFAKSVTYMGRLFGTDGIRGKAHEYPVTTEMATKLGHAIVEVFGGEQGCKVVIGRDTRESGAALQEALTKGLCEAGADVVNLGILPSPAVAFLVRKSNAAAAVMLTASHNPFADNGMKIFGADGFKLDDELEGRIEGLLLDENFRKSAEVAGSVSEYSGGLECYAVQAKASVPGLDLFGMKLVIDAGNGAGSGIAPRVFRDLGAEVVEIGVSPNGRNINENCGALHAAAAGRVVKEVGADLAICLDGDADRVTFTTADGDVVNGDRILALSGMVLKKAGKLKADTIVATVMSNLGLDEAMEQAGIRVLRAGVGDRLVLERMRAHGLSFGGENSGHLIFADHATTGDGIIGALQICKMIRDTGKSLKELSLLMHEYPSTLLNIPVARKPAISELPKLQALIAEAEVEFGNRGRQLIRYSGTENKIRILVEHKDAATVDLWIEKFRKVIEEEIG